MLTLRVRSVTYEAEGICSYELVDPQGADLPTFEAGAHIDVQVPGGFLRQYSLCDPPWFSKHYRFAVLDDPQGRGGSRAVHEHLRPGSMVEISSPRNLFPLNKQAKHSLLIAGGIGITPMLAMAKTLEREGQSFHLHYCTRSLERTAFQNTIQAWVDDGLASLHIDGGDPEKGLNLTALLADAPADTHVYFCGPNGFMNAVKQATAHWPEEQVHYEYFGVDPALAASLASGQGGVIRLAKSALEIEAQPGKTVLASIRDAGVECVSSCEAGLCGACKVRYLSGSPEHNDFILSEDERDEYVLICCAQVGDTPLLLDL